MATWESDAATRMHNRDEPSSSVQSAQNIFREPFKARLAFCKIGRVRGQLLDKLAHASAEFLFTVGYSVSSRTNWAMVGFSRSSTSNRSCRRRLAHGAKHNDCRYISRQIAAAVGKYGRCRRQADPPWAEVKERLKGLPNVGLALTWEISKQIALAKINKLLRRKSPSKISATTFASPFRL
jgi:hypothetical protein